MADVVMPRTANAKSARNIFTLLYPEVRVRFGGRTSFRQIALHPINRAKKSAIENRGVSGGRPHHLPLLTKKSFAAAFARISVQLALFLHRKMPPKPREPPRWPCPFPAQPPLPPSTHPPT